jgi:preprotein translocase subunit YajC
MGIGILAGVTAAAPKSGGGGTGLLLVFVVIFGLFYFVMIRPQRSRQRRITQTQREIVPGMRVRTTAGMYGTVTSIDDQDVTLEVAPGVEVRFLRRAVMDVIPDDSGTGFAGQAPADAASLDGFAASDGSGGEKPGSEPEAGTTSETPETGSTEGERSGP